MDERDVRTVRKHNAFADTFGWQKHTIIHIGRNPFSSVDARVVCKMSSQAGVEFMVDNLSVTVITRRRNFVAALHSEQSLCQLSTFLDLFSFSFLRFLFMYVIHTFGTLSHSVRIEC